MAYPSPDTKLRDLVFVGFDTETTGLSPVAARLVELSGVKFRLDGSVVSTFSTLIDPETTIPAEATAVHGITSTMVKGQPTCRAAIPDFFRWLQGEDVVLIAHNASFDMDFLDMAFATLKLPIPAVPVIDTLPLCRRLLPQSPNHKLKTLTEHLGLDTGDYHRALADSYHVKNLLVHLLPLIPSCQTWGQLSANCGVLKFTDLLETGFSQVDTVPARFESLLKAINAGERLKLVYNNGQTDRPEVTPLAVYKWKGHLYLKAHCHTTQSDRPYRLDKIVSFQILPQ